MEKIKFGTDGWRGVISDNFTFENVRRVAAAIADYFNAAAQQRGNKAAIKMAVGYDTRFLSDIYARMVSEVLAGKGIDVILSDRAVPTPALSFAVKQKRLTAGVMITASHNPASYNGIKIKTGSGGAAPPEVTHEVEKLLPRYPLPVARYLNSIVKKDLTGDYIKFLRSYINLSLLKKTGFRILVDAMHGSGNGFIARVLGGTKVKSNFIRNQINPSFGGLRPEPVLENLGPTIEELKNRRYDLGLVLDGDADRIAAFAGRGEFIHPQKILGLLILHLVRNRKMSGGVVKTIVGTTLIDKITGRLNLKLYETPVGFKYISELMEKEDILVGGEEAGGIGFKGYIPERDGSLAGLLLLEMMAYRKKPMLKILNEMEREFGRYYYLREDIHLAGSKPKGATALSAMIDKFRQRRELSGKEVIQVKDFDGVKLICEDESWLMLRRSGTEPLVRVYAEAKTGARAKRLLDLGKNFVK
ncbi:MAG: phosphoglucomutase/phosphomannomutase family protein [Candidatus Omnitrophota bacterium]